MKPTIDLHIVLNVWCFPCYARYTVQYAAKLMTNLDGGEINARMMIMIMMNELCGMINLRTVRSRSSST